MFMASIGDGRENTQEKRRTALAAAKAVLKQAKPGHIRMTISENEHPPFIVVHAEDTAEAIKTTKQMLARMRR